MARTGRPPKPLEAHRRDGTRSEAGAGRVGPNRQRTGKLGPKTPTLVGGRKPPKPVAGMAPDVRRAFRAIVRELEDVLDSADGPIVEAAAVMLTRARWAAAEIAEHGVTMTVTKRTKDGTEYEAVVVNPAVKIERDAWQAFRQLADGLGIGPSARARLAALRVAGREPAKEIAGLAGLRVLPGGQEATGS